MDRENITDHTIFQSMCPVVSLQSTGKKAVTKTVGLHLEHLNSRLRACHVLSSKKVV